MATNPASATTQMLCDDMKADMVLDRHTLGPGSPPLDTRTETAGRWMTPPCRPMRGDRVSDPRHDHSIYEEMGGRQTSVE